MERFAAAKSWNLEQSYEQRPRAHKRAKKEAAQSNRLPIKTASGVVQRVEAPPSPAPTESESEDEDIVEEVAPVSEKRVDENKPKVPERQRVFEAKEELARVASMINEDPEENIGMTRRMRDLVDDHNPTIQKLALVALVTVYVDVIPGYRIRPLTEEEKKVKVSKEIKKLRTFEQGLLSGYQDYLAKLLELIRASRKSESPSSASIARVAATCASRLLTAVPHFNFRGELLKMVVEVISVRTVDETHTKCRVALEELFRTDEDGTASFEAVQMITKMLKGKNFRVDESVLNTFLSLRLLSELDVKASTDVVENPRKRKKDRQFRTKKARKQQKQQKELEKELKEADATVSNEERERIQSETLKLVFVTYFKILKERPAGLMGATLEGLAKFASLINLDFFGDLLVALKELIADAELTQLSSDPTDEATTRNATRESLLCVITAFTLLASQGDKMLNVDLTFFTNHLYTILFPLCLDADIEFSHKSLRLPDPDSPDPLSSRVNVATEVEMLIRALDALFFKQNAGTNPLRVAAFTKRTLTASLQMPEKSCLASIGVVNKLGKKYHNRVAGLFSTEESIGDGVYKMEVEEPERSNPYAATVWETVLLKKHYCPAIAEAAKGMEKAFTDGQEDMKRRPRR